MNDKFFLTALAIREQANKKEVEIKSLTSLDDVGLCYRVVYRDDTFQEFRIAENPTTNIVFMTKINETL